MAYGQTDRLCDQVGSWLICVKYSQSLASEHRCQRDSLPTVGSVSILYNAILIIAQILDEEIPI